MALVIDLKPNEKVIIGTSTIINDKQRTRLMIEGDAPILREKDTMTAEDATSPSKKLYLTIQTMYLSPPDKALERLDDYFAGLDTIRTLAPHISNFLNDISIHILQGTYYKGLKLVQDLINFEQNGEEPSHDTETEPGGFNVMQMEAQLLEQSADQLKNTYDQWDTMPPNEREANISYNRKLWMMFFDGVNDPTGQKQVKIQGTEGLNLQANIVNLCNYIYKRSSVTTESGDKELIKTLIDLNRETAKAMRRG